MGFRESVIRLYSKCLITGNNLAECDAAHIVPRSICNKLGYRTWSTDPYNAMMLSKNIHSLFDRYRWTFDIYDWEPDPDVDYIRIRSLIYHETREHHPATIAKYLNPKTPYRIPKMSLKYLVIHYHAYFINNHSEEKLTQQQYQFIIDQKKYRLRCDDSTEIRKPSYFLAKRKKQVKVLWEEQPYRNSTWINSTA